ncbi:hypothetical protein INT45_009796 [Circinella minor]|uniref:Tc1-like transposase DDE domain-containing protein n=1 Tax=Circinella minor TaxID=1195481 RepID=A0A8H7RK29_9FUNG|nr:hypothetical protein INT45_009796 [Circinella minor]
MDFINYQPETDAYGYADSNDDIDFESTAIEYGNIEMIVNFDDMKEAENERMIEAVNCISEEIQVLSINNIKRYKKYGQDQIERFICLKQEEGLSIPKAAAQCGIPRSTAYELINEFNSSDGTVLPGNNPRKSQNKAKKLFPVHSEFLIQLFDQNPSIVLEQARIQLCERFPGLEISIPGLYKHIREKCALSLKQATKYTAERDSPRTLQLRFDIITQWKANGVDFKTNCVFVDEAGFHTQMIRGCAWSKKGDPAVVQDLDKPKKLPKGTTAYHIVKFMNVVMDTLDKHDKKGMFIVLDNCRIHHSQFVTDVITRRGYKALFMLPYSPFLNPIEECWSKIKKLIRRNPLDERDTLTLRIAEACLKVTVEDCNGWIRHAETYWDR